MENYFPGRHNHIIAPRYMEINRDSGVFQACHPPMAKLTKKLADDILILLIYGRSEP